MTLNEKKELLKQKILKYKEDQKAKAVAKSKPIQNIAGITQEVVQQPPETKTIINPATGVPSIQTTPPKAPKGFNPWATVNQPPNDIQKALAEIPLTIADYVIKPPIAAALRASVGPLIASNRRRKVLKDNIKKDDKGEYFTKEDVAKAAEAEAQPVNFPLIGNINPITDRRLQGMENVKAQKENAGAIMDVAGAVVPGSTVTKVGVSSFLQGAGKEMQKEESTASDVLYRGATEGTLGALTFGVLNKFLGPNLKNTLSTKEGQMAVKNTEIAKQSKKALESEGVPSVVGEFFEGLDAPAKKYAKKIMDAAEEAAADTTMTAPNVFDVAGKEIEDFVQAAEAIKGTLGKRVGIEKEGLRNIRIYKNKIADTFAKVENSLNIKRGVNEAGNEILDFTDSAIIDVPDAKKALNRIFKKLKADAKTINGFDAEAITTQIDVLTGLLKSTGFKKTPANRALAQIKSTINQELGEASTAFGGKFGEVNSRHAQLAEALDQVLSATSVKAGKKRVQSGAQLLRRLIGNAPAKNQEAIKAIEYLTKEFNLPDLGNLVQKAKIADFAEKITGTVNPQSLAGVTNQPLISKALRSTPLVKSVMDVKDVASAILTQLKANQAPQRKASALKSLLETVDKDVLKKTLEKNKIIDNALRALNINIKTMFTRDQGKENKAVSPVQ